MADCCYCFSAMAREGGHDSRSSGSPNNSQNKESLMGIPSGADAVCGWVDGVVAV